MNLGQHCNRKNLPIFCFCYFLKNLPRSYNQLYLRLSEKKTVLHAQYCVLDLSFIHVSSSNKTDYIKPKGTGPAWCPE